MPFKLFVGQIPKTMDEEGLRAIFSEYGIPSSVDIIRDKVTMAHKGCAFISFETKEEAEHIVNTLHNVKILPSMHSPMQVKYAEGELQKIHHKLFVGMLPKTATEDHVRDLFSPYGEIEEVTILKDGTGASRCCGFVKYKDRDQALQAINVLHGTIMEGQTKGLIVRFAETEQAKREKMQLKILATQQAQMLRLNPLLTQLINPLYSQPLMPPTASQAAAAQAAAPAANPYQTASPYTPYMQPAPQQYADAAYAQGAQANLNNAYNNLASAYTNPYAMYGAAPLMVPQLPEGPQKQVSGPPGANLFIYHLPQEWRDPDLLQTFAPYGNVISVKVFIDKNTLASKCFGFVSYDNAISAAEAISKLNGLQVRGNKRLKVEIKRNQNPY